MANNELVYVTYIRTTPERLWDAISKPEFTERYWFGRRVECGGQPRGVMNWYANDILADSGEIIEFDPPRRLVFTMRVEFDAGLRAEGHTRVTFEIEPVGSEVRLCVTHTGFQSDSRVREGCARGWSMILSSLKSLLETDRPMEITGSAAAKAEEQRATGAVR
ncbi:MULTISPECIES: SRPBCC family protein [unclassified Sinorhizobium]|uniref:SRPBCC family protein n=1 Tax=unclassified Sinorhizobium TaxID=2613772 RepID=UPI003524C1B1